MHKLPRFKDYSYLHLNPLLDKLWPAFLRGNSNSFHWFAGSDSSSDRFDDQSLLLCAFRSGSPQPSSETSKDWRSEYLPDAAKLLQGEDAQVWKLLRCIEAYYYAVNRYPGDTFAVQMRETTDLVSTIRGELHSLLQAQKFAIAWMMQSLCEDIFPWDDDDLLTAAGEEFCWHHDLRVEGQDYETVFKWFKKWQFAADVGAAERLRCLLVLVGRGRFFYPHQQEKLMSRVEEWNRRDGQEKRNVVDLNWLADTLAQHVEERRNSGDYERFCNFTGKSSRDVAKRKRS
jgi:hypothetical protein